MDDPIASKGYNRVLARTVQLLSEVSKSFFTEHIFVDINSTITN